MKIYLGGDGKKKILELAFKNGWGRMVSCPYYRNPIEGLSWALDNGTWSAWKNNTNFDSEKFLSCLDKIPSNLPPDFIVCPDIVAGGIDSLEFSLDWIQDLPQKYEYYLAAQDGMIKSDVIPHLDKFSGIFVGGTLTWKLRTAGEWTIVAHKNGLRSHIGRIGTYKNLCFAKFINADSCDSSTFVQASIEECIKKRLLPLWSYTSQTHLCNALDIRKPTKK